MDRIGVAGWNSQGNFCQGNRSSAGLYSSDNHSPDSKPLFFPSGLLCDLCVLLRRINRLSMQLNRRQLREQSLLTDSEKPRNVSR
jgi:hypothetical protein